MGMRDMIVHHYFDIDHETIYHVCKDRIPGMKKAIEVGAIRRRWIGACVGGKHALTTGNI